MTDSSPTTAEANAFVEAHLDAARTLGSRLADHLQDETSLAATLHHGLAALADPSCIDGQRQVAPGIGTIHGVRRPLLAAVSAAFRAATREDRATTLLFVADRLLREDHLEAHWLAFDILQRTLPGEPERTWQLMRRAARTADDWITVDSLAAPYAAGVALEAYRWSELEQLVYSPSRWERRLVGSTIATMTHGDGRANGGDIVARAMPILEQLLGDAEPDVQKALAWAYRSLAALDRETITSALRRETDLAVRTADGHRAWVIRDSLVKLDPGDAETLRASLAGIRCQPDAPSTSSAAATVAAFGAMPDPSIHPEPPL